MTTTVLILGGTTEARELADLLTGHDDLHVVTSYAGRTRQPHTPQGTTRTGGFGGADGLREWLHRHRPAILVDATHPFAETVGAHAAAAHGAPRLRLLRPGWTEQPKDRWNRVPNLETAAAVLPTHGARAFITTGRQRLDVFTTNPACGALPLLLVRCIEPPADDLPTNVRVILDRGPYTVDSERGLIHRHGIDVVVAKDSGGDATRAKLDAARERGIPVILVNRPIQHGMPTVDTPAAAAVRVRELVSGP
ncbi:cobalt-precorrin-6A reductase [Asanoa iriomotensis]|uniref:Precorrin-6A reductase n=1 Tax=Asanoa iriomotensis TaxID=234613 RepID=A0ABQ4C615_9ACTN|nr:cobalt-precorrin-6A reductase [Asanoa iriomotensis]GIF58222.1 precorrin-6A reductase [Asanoa iriomotensis]